MLLLLIKVEIYITLQMFYLLGLLRKIYRILIILITLRIKLFENFITNGEFLLKQQHELIILSTQTQTLAIVFGN